jgi:HlyD family secretion protein
MTDAASTRSTAARLGSLLPACRRRRACRWGAAASAAFLGAALVARGVLEPGPSRYLTVPVDRGDVTSAVTASGAVMPLVATQVGSQLSGQIADILVDFNTPVEKGQLLARLDPRSHEAEVRESEAALAMASSQVLTRTAAVRRASAAVDKARALRQALEARAASAQAEHRQAVLERDRRRSLVERKAVAKSEVDDAEAGVDSARALLEAARAEVAVQSAEIRDAEAALEMAGAELENARAVVEQRRAALERALVDLARTRITAPIDGLVIRRDVDTGQTVAASLQAPTLFTLAQDLKRMKLEVRVDEADIGRVRVGQTVQFGVDAYPRRRFEGAVVQIRKAPEIHHNVVTYTVVVSADNPDEALFPGMTAVVRILVEEATGVLRVPNAALRFAPREPGASQTGPDASPQAAGDRVWALAPSGRPAAVAVRLGISDGQFSAVTAGALEPGQRVIVGRLPEEAR